MLSAWLARELRSGRTLRLWRDQLGKAPPYRSDRRAAVRLLRRAMLNAPAIWR